MILRERALAHRGGDHGRAQELREVSQFGACLCSQNTAANEDHRALRAHEQLSRTLDLGGIALDSAGRSPSLGRGQVRR